MKRHSSILPFGGIRLGRVFWHAVSPSNSLVVTWENSPVNRDVNSLTNFQAELFADGSFVYRYDDRTVAYSRVHPLDLDFDGQVGGQASGTENRPPGIAAASSRRPYQRSTQPLTFN